MKLKQQVVTLELAKRLKKLGVKQESYFWWAKNRQTAFPSPWIVTTNEKEQAEKEKWGPAFAYEWFVSAFTSAELGEILPQEINIPFKNGKPRRHDHWLRFGRYHASEQPFYCGYHGGNTLINPTERAGTEADARAQMLIYLLENNLIKLQ